MREGLLPATVTSVLCLSTDEASARRLTELFGELFEAEETGVAAFENEAGGHWRLEVYFAAPPDEAAVRALVASATDAATAARASFETVSSDDWVAASLAGLKPVVAGRFMVHGAHDRAVAQRQSHKIAVEIEAALAFGTGHHGTTLGCLAALDRLLKRRRPRRVLDVGTGTGVLAIAAAKALRRVVTATDIDPIAAMVARENGKLNAAAAYIRLAAAPGLRHSAVVRGSPFDLVLANILYKPLTRLAPAIAAALAPGGEVILSGLLRRDVAGILSTYRGCGLALLEHGEIEGWATLVLRRGGAAPRARHSVVAP